MPGFSKDRWILDALGRRYLIPRKDGSIYRCTSADKDGKLLSSDYRQVVFQTHRPTGRVYFNMTWRGFTKSVLVNRVIALAFIPNPLNLPQVNHLDGIKSNNAVTNLEWATGSENERHAHATGLKTGRGSANANAKISAKDALEIRNSGESISLLMQRFGLSRSAIFNIRTGKTWKHI